MVCFVNQLIATNLDNKENFEIKVSRKIRIFFLISAWNLEIRFKVSFPYSEVSDRSYEDRVARVNRFDSKTCYCLLFIVNIVL